jgi:ATP-dependent Clp protease ATP-binding subunit ClpA
VKLKNPVRDVRTIKRLLSGAEAEARQAGESLPGAEHLLLSALALPDGSAKRAFERLGADPDQLRPAIAAAHAEALRAIGIEPPDDDALDAAAGEDTRAPTGVFRSNAPAQSAFQAAAQLARAERSQRVGAHIVAAVAEMEHGTAARALTAMRIDRAALAAAAREETGSARP